MFVSAVVPATACLGYHIFRHLSTAFFQVFLTACRRNPFRGFCCPPLHSCRITPVCAVVSMSSSATGVMISLKNRIVNVFLVFYLFRTIQINIGFHVYILSYFLFISNISDICVEFLPLWFQHSFIINFLWNKT